MRHKCCKGLHDTDLDEMGCLTSRFPLRHGQPFNPWKGREAQETNNINFDNRFPSSVISSEHLNSPMAINCSSDDRSLFTHQFYTYKIIYVKGYPSIHKSRLFSHTLLTTEHIKHLEHRSKSQGTYHLPPYLPTYLLT